MSEQAERYNRIYSKSEAQYGDESDAIVQDAIQYIAAGNALDVGAGQGRNSTFLAEHGFAVTAIDFSEVGVGKIKTVSEERKLNIKTEISDIRDLNLSENYDLIVTNFTLHNISSEEALNFLNLMQNHTSVNGVNVIATFMKESDFYEKMSSPGDFYPEQSELVEIYHGWEILKSEVKETQAVQKNKDGSSMVNSTIELIARKLN